MSLSAKRGIFVAIVVLWLLLDQAAKLVLGQGEAGEVIYESKLGILNLVLVHNTGGAWGVFAGFPAALGVISLIVCALILVYLLTYGKGSSLLSYVSLALVFAGGAGNAVDRFWHGYVIDFFSTAFMDFPVFNIADIGVTVGVGLFIVSLFIDGRKGDGTTDQP